MTNADRIRSMTDEELAEYLRRKSDCCFCAYSSDAQACYSANCSDGVLEYLKQEVPHDQ